MGNQPSLGGGVAQGLASNMSTGETLQKQHIRCLDIAEKHWCFLNGKPTTVEGEPSREATDEELVQLNDFRVYLNRGTLTEYKLIKLGMLMEYSTDEQKAEIKQRIAAAKTDPDVDPNLLGMLNLMYTDTGEPSSFNVGNIVNIVRQTVSTHVHEQSNAINHVAPQEDDDNDDVRSTKSDDAENNTASASAAAAPLPGISHEYMAQVVNSMQQLGPNFAQLSSEDPATRQTAAETVARDMSTLVMNAMTMLSPAVDDFVSRLNIPSASSAPNSDQETEDLPLLGDDNDEPESVMVHNSNPPELDDDDDEPEAIIVHNPSKPQNTDEDSDGDHADR